MLSIAYGFLDLLSRSLMLHRDKTGAAASFKYKYSRGVERVSAFLGHRPAQQPSVGLALLNSRKFWSEARQVFAELVCIV